MQDRTGRSLTKEQTRIGPIARAVWAGVVFLIAAGGGIAFAAVPDLGSVCHACLLKAALTTRMIDPSLPSDTRSAIAHLIGVGCS